MDVGHGRWYAKVMEIVKSIRIFFRWIFGIACGVSVLQAVGITLSYWEKNQTGTLIGMVVFVILLGLIVWGYRKVEKSIFGW